MSFVLPIGLALVTCLSPLLTFAWLWQVKEWRWDRLREHVLRERTLMPLLGGRLRPGIVALYAAAVLALQPDDRWLLAALGLLAVLSVAQIVLRRQRMPVWTTKARILLGGTLVLDAMLAVALSLLPAGPFFLPLLAIAQAACFACAWAAFLPVDRLMKRRILTAAKALREAHPELTVIGITGSVGKTTTKELLAHVLRDRQPLFTPAHVNSDVGVAQWILKHLPADPLPARTPLIVEMGAYRIGEIAALCAFVQPSLGIVTFIGNQHLALFGSPEALLEAKGELLRALPADGRAFLNGDCERCRGMTRFCACPVTVVGTGGSADLEAYDIEETPTGIRFSVGGLPFALPLHGTHNIANALLVVAASEFLGLERGEIARRVATFRPPHRTFEMRTERGVTILDDTHNASAESFKAAIAWAKTQPFERKILLTSGIIELGEEHERTHRELGGLAADVFDDVLFLDDRTAPFFAEGYGKPLSPLSKAPSPVPAGSLLVCIGRMAPSVIKRLLP